MARARLNVQEILAPIANLQIAATQQFAIANAMIAISPIQALATSANEILAPLQETINTAKGAAKLVHDLQLDVQRSVEHLMAQVSSNTRQQLLRGCVS
jgi:hypothetical protein